MKYLDVSVLTTPAVPGSWNEGIDCTAGGVTATHAQKLVVPCEDGYLTLEDVTERGYKILELQKSLVQGAPGHFTPEGVTRHTMFGGNYVTTSDSRFRRAYGWSPIAVHDRIEL